jgi:succinate dehydrogenase/fumarate reductase cytochrome b subunit
MSIQRILGFVLLICGIVLIIVGVNATRSFGNQVSNFFSGHFTNTTMLYIIGGIVAAVAGLVLVLRRFGTR